MADDETEEGQELPTGPVENAWNIPIPEFKKGDMKHPLLEESNFSILFPKYREKYLRECWPVLQKALDEYGVKCDLDVVEGRMSVYTTRKTWDPAIILKARAIIILLGRSVPVEQAIKVLKDGNTHEIIKVIRVVEQTMENIHPVYLLKTLMIKKQLSQDPKMKNEDWSRFIPNFKSKNVQRKQPKKKKEKKPYTPFPPPQLERKVDKDMAEGSFFIKQEEQKKAKKRRLPEDKKKEVVEKQTEKRAKAFVAPEEPEYKPLTKTTSSNVDIDALKKKVKKLGKK
ncbi:KRR1 small subunit processome component homolog dbe isoform X2 [Oratosquilla oratoria]|uniref:KRR1 small subunit processome component homolog dbe isoform X2 n=1 Tax=Oratosquilla oratoria TaxID=337810 RepID=UPI003F758D31